MRVGIIDCSPPPGSQPNQAVGIETVKIDSRLGSGSLAHEEVANAAFKGRRRGDWALAGRLCRELCARKDLCAEKEESHKKPSVPLGFPLHFHSLLDTGHARHKQRPEIYPKTKVLLQDLR